MNKQHHEIFKLKGIVKDVEPVELMNGEPPQPGVPTPAVWTAGANIHFDDESTHRVGGYSRFADPLPDNTWPIFQLSVLTPTEAYWIWVDGKTPEAPNIYVTDGSNHFDITPTAGLTGGEIGQWTGCVLNSVPVLNNGVDEPIWWDGQTSNPMTVLPDWPADATARSVRAFKYHLIAMNITDQGITIPDRIMWSSAADPGTIPQEWSPTPGNDAGDATLSATPGGVVDGLKLRSDFIVYKQHSTYILSYVAGNYVFNIRSLFTTTGVQSVNCVKELRGRHFVLADDDVIEHDGNTFHSIADKQVRQFILDGINPESQIMCHLAIRVPTDEVWVCVPQVDSQRVSAGLLYSFTDKVWGLRELPEVAYVADGIIPKEDTNPTWDEADTTWYSDARKWDDANYSLTNDRLLMSEPAGGRMLNVDASNDNDGEPIEAWIERRDWTIAGVNQIWDNDLVRTIFPIISGSEGDEIQVRVAGSFSPGSVVTWSPEQTIQIGGNTRVDALVYGRYLNLRFSSKGGNIWQLHRVGVEFIPKAKY